jgi:hypothetical protein
MFGPTTAPDVTAEVDILRLERPYGMLESETIHTLSDIFLSE